MRPQAAERKPAVRAPARRKARSLGRETASPGAHRGEAGVSRPRPSLCAGAPRPPAPTKRTAARPYRADITGSVTKLGCSAEW